MSLDKAIEHGKEKREPYRGSKRFDHSCRNHGGCKWCEGNRKHKFVADESAAEIDDDDDAAATTPAVEGAEEE